MEIVVIISVTIGLLIMFAIIKFYTPVMLSRQHYKLLSTAQQGDLDALAKLVYEYHNTHYRKHFKQNPAQAVDVFNAAKHLIEIGDENYISDEEYYTLGSMYEEGFGTEKDTTKAVEYFNKALEFINNLNEEDAEIFKSSVERIKQKLQQYS